MRISKFISPPPPFLLARGLGGSPVALRETRAFSDKPTHHHHVEADLPNATFLSPSQSPLYPSRTELGEAPGGEGGALGEATRVNAYPSLSDAGSPLGVDELLSNRTGFWEWRRRRLWRKRERVCVLGVLVQVKKGFGN
ncbi:hypothetical protein NL676_009787 [Syzygium grande]|nr:hypothetical protein NL676_009787 [Syzygium grande]